jgi:hypothetical protein
MSFFKFNKEIKTEDLKLSDYDQIWTKFCFLDETGSLNDVNDPFFTVGILKLSQPYYLASKIDYERRKRNFHDELKFNKLSKNNLEFAKFVIDAVFDTRSVNFCSYSVDKHGDYFNREFGGDPWRAYEKLTVRLIHDAALADKEILILIADYVPAPSHIKYEASVKKEINKLFNRLALAGVCRFDSRSNDLLQTVDILIGAISYDLKLASGIIQRGSKYKRRLLEHLKTNLGVAGFIDGFRNRNFNIFVDKDMKQRLPLKTNEKGPSS